MNRISSAVTSLSLGLVVFLAACGSDSPTGVNSGDQLTDAEIQALLTALGGVFEETGGGFVASRQAGLAAAPAAHITVEESFDVSVPCQSGSVGVDGSVDGWVDDETFEAELNMGFNWTFNACLVPAETITITVSGEDPSIALDMDFLLTEDEISLSGTLNGGFSFVTSDDRAGSCAIDITSSASYNGVTQTATASSSGTVCGVTASRFQTFTIEGTT